MTFRQSMAQHWPEYLIEAFGLCVFMISACLFVSLIEYPTSPVHAFLSVSMMRRGAVGIAMGMTAIMIIYSPWGQRSGAHLNPALTAVFFLLGKIEPWDALCYVAFQFAGGILGVMLARLVLGETVMASPWVHYVVTQPGLNGANVALLAETLLSFGLMLTVLIVSNHRRWHRFTGLAAGSLVALYITVEAPLSGMSMNPARSLGSAVSAQEWTGLWVYFTAPLAGMLLAAVFYGHIVGKQAILCCKLHHDIGQSCIFRCQFWGKEVAATASGDQTVLVCQENAMNTHLSLNEEDLTGLENAQEVSRTESGTIVCPVCGGLNPADSVFCATPSCHKALGEFKYVLEEIGARKNWLERLADHIAQFVSKPHFIIFHVIWFSVWIMLNQGYLGIFSGFDSYPFDLLSFILAIEAILVTGFLLISQNYQYEYAEKRAELDYEINIRSYRKLLELEKRLDALTAKAIRPDKS